MAEFVETTNAALQQQFPGIQHVIFGHLGDGNLHYNVARGNAYTEDELLDRQGGVYELVHDSVHRFGGSISAEHGVGQLKRAALPKYKAPIAPALMHRIKQVLDTHGLITHGKVLLPCSDTDQRRSPDRLN